MRKVIGLVVLFWVCFGYAQPAQVHFHIKNFGINVEGNFSEVNIAIDRDDSGIIKHIEGSVNVASINTGINSRDEHLLEKDYFHTTVYPIISFQSTAIEQVSITEYNIGAMLSIKGTRLPVNIKGEVVQEGGKDIFKTKFQINRRDYDVGGGGVLGKTVKIEVIYYFNY